MDSRLLERDRELQSVTDWLAETVRGRGSTLLIRGVPGVGKSRLLDEAAAHARAGAITQVARFRCGELERDFPWSAVLGMLTAATAGSTKADQHRLFDGAAAPAARLLRDPALAAADLDPFSVMHGIYVVFERMAQRAPLILVLDDAHWSDPQSLQQLLYLARRLPQIAAGLLVAARPAGGADPQRALLDAMLELEGSRAEELSALSPQAVTALIRGGGLADASQTLCHACARLTGGNPFLLQELLMNLRASEEAPEVLVNRLAETPPETIIRAVVVRLARAGSTASGLGRSLAVLDDGATLAEAAALAGIGLTEATQAADTLAGAQILARGEPLRFVHPLIRSAIYSDIPEVHRSAAHARAAELLESHGAAPELVAVHLLKVPLTRTLETVERLRVAARSASRHGAPATAARFLARALLEAPTEAERARVLVELADAESRNGDPAAVQHLREALILTPRSQHAPILLALGWVEHHAGRFSDAAEAFERGLRLASKDSPALVQELEAGYLQSASLDTSRAAIAAVRMRALEEAPDPVQGTAQRLLLAQVLFGRVVSGRDREGVVALALRLWDDGRLLEDEGADSQTIWHVAGALSWSDAYEDAHRVIRAALQSAETEGAALAYARGCYARSWLNLWTGQIAAAADDARTAISIWYGGLETYLPAAVYWLVRAELERNDVEAASAAMSLTGPAERWRGTGMDGFYLAAQGDIAAHRHEPDRALDCHLRCGELMRELQVLSPSVMPWRSSAAASAKLLGRDDLARELADAELALARSVRSPRALGVSLRASARLSAPPEAVPELRESVAVLEGCGAGLEQAKSVVELGAVLRRSGHRRSARPLLRQGLDMAERMGSTTLQLRAAEELDAAGGRRSGHAAGGREALTASEYRVCALAAQGHPNRYIAGHLSVSVKAVEWHLSQSYRKLGIASRRELAGALDLTAR